MPLTDVLGTGYAVKNSLLVVAQSYIPFFFHEVSSFSCDGFIVNEGVRKDECADFKDSER